MTPVDPLVSIIVPVYNSEFYLEECLNSIVNQTYQSIEILLINDGSTDGSHKVMESFAVKDHRIITLTQPNRGVSAARNAGLRVATGEYILFVDSDDTIRNDTVEILCRKAILANTEIVLGNVYYCYPDGEQTPVFQRLTALSKHPPLEGEECFSLLMETYLFPTLVYLYFTKRSFIQERQLFFEEGIVHEDELWCTKTLVYAPKVSVVDVFHYFYRIREGSIMQSENKKYRINSLMSVAKSLEVFAAELQEKQEFVRAAGFVYVRLFCLYYCICKLLHEMKEGRNEYTAYFAQLLHKISPVLSQLQRRYCSNYFHSGNRLLLND